MSNYLVEAYASRWRKPDLAALARKAQGAAAALTSEGTQVRYVGALFVPDDESCLCLYEGQTAEAVQRAVKRAGISCDRVLAALTDLGFRASFEIDMR